MDHKGNNLMERAIKVFAFSWMIWFVFPLLFLIGAFFFKIHAVSAVLSDPRFWAAFWVSIISSIIVIIVSIIFAVPTAHFLTYHDFKYKKFLETLLIDVPQTFPPVAIGVIYLFAFGPGSPINLAFTFTAVVISKIIISAPFALGYVLRRFRQINESNLDLVARSLGASTRDVLFRVLIPLSRQDIAAGLTMASARAMGEFGGSLIFAGTIAYKTEVLPTYTNRVVATDPFLALAATTVMTIFALISLTLAKAVFSKSQ